MSTEHLLDFILNQSGILPRTFSGWVKSSGQFRNFAEKYKGRICDKFVKAKAVSEKGRICDKFVKAKAVSEYEERLKDTLFELEIAYLILTASKFSVLEYKRDHNDRGPDFTFKDEYGVAFNVEVKRIRPTLEEKKLGAWRTEVARAVQAVQSMLAVAVHIGVYLDELNDLRNLLHRLECDKADVISFIVNSIQTEEKNIPIDGVARYSIPNFKKDEIELELRKPSGKPSGHTTFNGGAIPFFLTRLEWQKFKDLIFPEQKQRISGMVNVLAINTRSSTHDKKALIEELHGDFIERERQGNVTEQMKMLSGVLFLGAWENWLWLNEWATCQISQNIIDVLQQLTVCQCSLREQAGPTTA